MHLSCPGLPASWINAWLAGIGITVLDPRIRLHWTARDTPMAVLSSVELDPVGALVESWPSKEFLKDLPIADGWRGTGELRRKVTIEQFVDRAQQTRGDPNSWALSSTMTDLSVSRDGEVAHAPLDPAGPGTTKWLHHRLLRLHELIGPVSEERLRSSLAGRATRVRNNGLGFDSTRLGSLADASDPWTEPVIELLAFFGLKVFPARGPGMDRRLNRRDIDSDGRQRGWRRVDGGNKRRQFFWPAWRQPLDTPAIDALLDGWNPMNEKTWSPLGIHAAWRSVEYRSRASNDPTRAIGSEML